MNSKSIHTYLDREIVKTERAVAKAYKQALDDIRSQLSDLYEKYSEKGILTYAEMAKYNRLNSLQKTILDDFRNIWNRIDKEIRTLIGTEYEESFYRHGYLLDKDTGINLNFGIIDKETIFSLYTEPTVAGIALKDLLSNTRYNLLLKERQAMIQGFIKGESYVNIVKDLQQVFDKSFSDLLRIVRTEGTRAANAGQTAAYDEAEEMGIEFDRIWVATLDGRTRDSHQSLDGQKADKEGYFYYAGERAKHPGGFGVASLDINCRCRVIAKPKDVEYKVRRSNINKKDIIQYEIYEEWKKDQK